MIQMKHTPAAASHPKTCLVVFASAILQGMTSMKRRGELVIFMKVHIVPNALERQKQAIKELKESSKNTSPAVKREDVKYKGIEEGSPEVYPRHIE